MQKGKEKSAVPLTYISLFSGAGVGCFGFQQNGFECIATNELIERRLEVQKHNKKCKYESGYICGDITLAETKNQILDELKKWKRQEQIKEVDVLIATPPCQGMSVANHKKGVELGRNSLVIESIKMIVDTKPRFFILENVAAFLKTLCTDTDGKERPIKEAIFNNLGRSYSIYHRVINLKNYGSNSSRTRTLVIGVRSDLADFISPIELFPDYKDEKTLREVIGRMKSLDTMGEIDETDFYHAFRPYPERMRAWIHDLKESESAFDNIDEQKIPHRIINGKIVYNKNKNGDKYTRQSWDKIAPCVHTRNDQLASQNTVHPRDDRVFSVRELMEIMTIPRDFRWVEKSLAELNKLSDDDKKAIYKKEAVNIRQSIGEAVPTALFYSVAKNIKTLVSQTHLAKTDIIKYIKSHNLIDKSRLLELIKNNPDNLGVSTLSKIAEYANPQRQKNAAFFTDKTTITRIINELPDLDNNYARILEPSVGVGNFVPLITKNYQHLKKVEIDVLDIDHYVIKILKMLLPKMKLPKNTKVNVGVNDFLLHTFKFHYDLVVGNPPFGKLKREEQELLSKYKEQATNVETNNIFSFFIEKALKISDRVVLITPKALLNAPEYKITRSLLEQNQIFSIIDFGEKGFHKILIETVAIAIFAQSPKNNSVKIISVSKNFELEKKQDYICDNKFPYWIIYRNNHFDRVSESMTFDIFYVYRDRQITNRHLVDEGEVRVLRSRNIADDGKEVISINGYDKFIATKDIANRFSVAKFINDDSVYLTPNMTYRPRVVRKPKGVITNGSVAVLIPKCEKTEISDEDLDFFTTDEYRKFYNIARNYQTRSLNIDTHSVFFFGICKKLGVAK